MESKKPTEKAIITPNKKSMQTILFETVHGKIGHNCSPFRVLPNFSTPPSRFARITNPFEQHLIDKLHLPVFSPTVFSTMPGPKTEEKFKWTIEDIATLRPADIDETSIDQHVTNENDSAVEMTAQEKINTFFSEKEIVPSPMNQVTKSVPLVPDEVSCEKKSTNMCDGMSQTILTLPPVLPKHVENVLMPYFNYMENQQLLKNLTQSELCCKLFNFEDNNVDQNKSGSVHTSPPLSIGLLSPIQLSPFDVKMQSSRHFGSIDNVPILRECNLSPIGPQSNTIGETHECGVTAEFNFSDHMSVDSYVVPDTTNQLPSLNQSDKYEFPSIASEVFSDSTVNWDMEYKHISLISPTNSNANKMDVSNSNTPRSKIFCSQRKKLSDSFLKVDDTNEENKENIYEDNLCTKTDLFYSDDITDAGYQTGILTTSEEWTNTHLFASTPTKRKH